MKELVIVLMTGAIDKEILCTLLQNYESEFSAITKKLPNKMGIYPLDTNLEKCDNYLLIDNNIPIGFCVKGNCDSRHDIHEFYIIPSKRGEKIGKWFALEIFKRYKGLWQVRQIHGANNAKAFWRNVISNFTTGKFEEINIIDNYWGDITKQKFQSD